MAQEEEHAFEIVLAKPSDLEWLYANGSLKRLTEEDKAQFARLVEEKVWLDILQRFEAEIHFLRWFYHNADFAPEGAVSHDLTMLSLLEAYTQETGRPVPPVVEGSTNGR